MPVPRLRVLHIVPGLSLGGAETLLHGLATRDAAIDHRVICLGPRGWYSDRLEERGIRVEHLAMRRRPSDALRLARLYQQIRQAEADVVQAWLYSGNLLGGGAAKIAGLPVVWGIHSSSLGPLSFLSRLFAAAGGILAPWASDFVINCSERSAELHRRLGYGRAKGAVIPNGYDPAVFFPDEQSRLWTREALGIAPDAFVIGSIGRWHPQKDIPNLLAALRIAAGRGTPLRCLLIGTMLGPANRQLAKAIEQAGIAEIVVPLGRRSDIPDVARAIDFHVLASCGAEAFPNVVAETMLSATPNAVTDIGDSALIVGDTGWVVPPAAPEKLAAAIGLAFGEWKNDPAAWRARRTAARERIAERYTFERMAQAYEDVWRRVAEASRARLRDLSARSPR